VLIKNTKLGHTGELPGSRDLFFKLWNP